MGIIRRKVIDWLGRELLGESAVTPGTEELAERVGDAMSRLPFARGFCACEELEMRTDYDYVARSPRWYALYRLKTFQPKEG